MTFTLDQAIDFGAGNIRLSQEDLQTIRIVCPHLMSTVVDRKNLQGRTDFEKMHHLIMGELSELAVIKYFRSHGKYAESACDKMSGIPDLGHDVWLIDSNGEKLKCSVKSSNSHSLGWTRIVKEMNFPFTKEEIRRINVRAYFKLPSHRETLSISDAEEAMQESDKYIYIKLPANKGKNDKGELLFEFSVVEALTLQNMHQLFEFGKLLAFASGKQLSEGDFKEYPDPDGQNTRLMSAVTIAEGKPLTDLLDHLRAGPE